MLATVCEALVFVYIGSCLAMRVAMCVGVWMPLRLTCNMLVQHRSRVS